jgi:hypothetical protein
MTLLTQAAHSQVPVTARDIVSTMANVYAQCFTYCDEGKVKQKSGRMTVAFTTVFQRPVLFKFEYFRSSSVGLSWLTDHYVLWRTGAGDVQMWWTLRPQVQIRPMDRATASVAGVSAESGHVIPRLLMPEEVTGFSLASSWIDAAPPVEEIVGGHACYKVSGHYPFGRDEALSVWVDEESFLVRKLVDKRNVITYSPEINVAIDASAFQFQPGRASSKR